MKKFPIRLTVTTLAAVAATCTHARGTVAAADGDTDVNVIEMDLLAGGKILDEAILVILEENAPAHYQAPKLPRFAIIGKDRRYYLGIGGYVRGTVSFDFGNPIDNPTYFTTSHIRPVAKGNGAKTQVSMGTTNIFFNFVSLPGQKNQVGAYIDFNFDKDQYGLDLRHAYLTWRGFSAGYNYTLLADQQCAPATIDFEGAPSLPLVKTGQISWSGNAGHWGYGVGLEAPIYSITESASAQLVNQRMPSLPAYIRYRWGDSGYTRLAVIARGIQYRNLVRDKNRSRFGYGVQLSGTWEPLPAFARLYWQGIYGTGIADYIQDLNGMNLDLVPDKSAEGRLATTQQFGFMGGLRLRYNSRFSSNHTFSQVRTYADRYTAPTAHGDDSSDLLPWRSQYKYGQYLCNNVFYAIGQFQLGFEYIWGARKDMGGAFTHDNRLQLMAQLNF